IPALGPGAACWVKDPTAGLSAARLEPASAPGAGVAGSLFIACELKVAPRVAFRIASILAKPAGWGTTRPGSMACRFGKMSGCSILLPAAKSTGRTVPGRTGRPFSNALVLMAVPQGPPCEQELIIGMRPRPRGIHPIHPGPLCQVTSPGDQTPKLPGNHTHPKPGMKVHPP